MSAISTFMAPAGRSLKHHLHRLRETLDDLAAEVREAIAKAVGRSASEAIRDTVHLLLEGGSSSPEQNYRHQEYPASRSKWWGDHSYQSRYEEDEELDLDAWEQEEDRNSTQSSRSASGSALVLRKRLFQSIAAALQATAWCVRRGSDRFSALTAAAAGLAAGMMTFFGGSVAATGSSVVATAFGLFALTSAF